MIAFHSVDLGDSSMGPAHTFQVAHLTKLMAKVKMIAERTAALTNNSQALSHLGLRPKIAAPFATGTSNLGSRAKPRYAVAQLPSDAKGCSDTPEAPADPVLNSEASPHPEALRVELQSAAKLTDTPICFG